MKPDTVAIVIAAVALVVFLAFLVVFFAFIRLWIQALLTNTPVSLPELIGMRLRGTSPTMVVHALIVLRQRGVQATARGVESCYLAFAMGQKLTPGELVDLYLEQAGEPGPRA